MAKYPEMQAKMRKEVEEEIGDRLVMQEDKSNCHYVNAFISEVLRLRVVVPSSVPHKAMCDTEISEKQFQSQMFKIVTIVSNILFSVSQRAIRSRRTQ